MRMAEQPVSGVVSFWSFERELGRPEAGYDGLIRFEDHTFASGVTGEWVEDPELALYFIGDDPCSGPDLRLERVEGDVLAELAARYGVEL
jgi:hypothetical protein